MMILRVQNMALKKMAEALKRVLLDIDFMVEMGVIPDVRDDIIYASARKALEP